MQMGRDPTCEPLTYLNSVTELAPVRPANCGTSCLLQAVYFRGGLKAPPRPCMVSVARIEMRPRHVHVGIQRVKDKLKKQEGTPVWPVAPVWPALMTGRSYSSSVTHIMHDSIRP